MALLQALVSRAQLREVFLLLLFGFETKFSLVFRSNLMMQKTQPFQLWTGIASDETFFRVPKAVKW